MEQIFKSTLLGALCAALMGCLPFGGISMVTTTTTTSTTTSTGGGGGGGGSSQPIQVASITPSTDTTAGGALVTVSGSGFTGTNSVIITPAGASSPSSAASIVSVTDTQLLFTAPAFNAGLADIDISRTDGTTARLVQSFLYTTPVPTAPAPSLSSITPTAGPGGTVITLSGTDFATGATITVGAEPADLVSLTATSAVVIVRPGAGGAQDVTLTNPDTQSSTLTGAFNRNGAPVVTVNLPAGTQAVPGDLLTFTVHASDPEGDPLSLRLVNPPAGCFMMAVAGSGTQQSTVRWHVRPESAGVESLVFQAQDWQTGRNVGSTTALVQVSGPRAATLVGDVTGDGVPDVVAGSHRAGQGSGAIYVWSGAATPGTAPIAVCTDPNGTAGDGLGLTNGQGIFLRDITGDNVLDIVALAPAADVGGVTDAGAVLIWVGGSLLSGTPAPNVKLTVPGAAAGDRLGDAQGRAVRFGDVTGDGTMDLIVAAQYADRGSAVDAGAVYVWSGGVQIVTATAPLATLDAGTTIAGDQLGGAPGGNTAQTHDGLLLADVTGDAIDDVIATGTANGGSVYVWAGHPALSGTVAPAVIARAGAAWNSTTLGTATGQGVLCTDVTGDWIADLVVVAEDADVAGTPDAGAIFIWKGGTTLAGTPAPTCVCTATTPGAFERIGRAAGAGVRIQDVTGDGTPDIIAAAQDADVGGVVDAGALYVWNGGIAMTGTRAPAAELYSVSQSAGDRMGDAAGFGWFLAECTGDAVLDVIAGSRDADAAAVDAGRISVWKGGSQLWGTAAPVATCQVSGASAGDRLGHGGGRGIRATDVDGDRILDIVAVSTAASNGSVSNAGAIYAWFGGNNLSGVPAPVVTFARGAAAQDDALGSTGFWCVDLDGDGRSEIVAAAPQVDAPSAVDAGGYAVWRYPAGTGGTITETAFARRSAPGAGDQLGGGAVAFADLDGDGTLDLLGLCADADHSGRSDAGLLVFWSGSSLLSGTAASTATFGAANPTALDQLGAGAAAPLLTTDLDGDGVSDALITAPLADTSGTTDTGALQRVLGGSSVASLTSATQLAVISPSAGDRLGE